MPKKEKPLAERPVREITPEDEARLAAFLKVDHKAVEKAVRGRKRKKGKP